MSNFEWNYSMRRIILSVNPMKYLSCSIWRRWPYWLLWSAVAAFFICLPCFAFTKQNDEGAAEAERYIPWHLEEAELRFRIEKDPDYSQIPDVHLSDLKKKREWNGTYYRLNGKVYKKGVTMSAPATVTYKHEKEHGHFVALAGLADRASSDAQVTFVIYADKKRLYKSNPVTKRTSPIEIDVRVPAAAKELKIETTDSNIEGHRWANLVNAGYLLRGESPGVAYVKLHTPGYDARDFEVAVFTTIGQRVPSRLFWTGADEPMEVLFDNSYGSTTYFVYLVDKSKHKPASTSWEPKAGVTLETRYASKNYPECKELSGFLKV